MTTRAAFSPPAALCLPGLQNPRCKKACSLSRLFEFGRCQRLLATAWLALRAVADATFSRFARVEPPCPRRFSSSLAQMQKSLLVEQAFRIWSVIEDNSPLRGSPCGPLLTQRSLASLGSNLPAPGGSHPLWRRCKKACSLSRLFEFGR